MAAATEVKCLVDHDWGCKKFCVNGQLSISDPHPRSSPAPGQRPDRHGRSAEEVHGLTGCLKTANSFANKKIQAAYARPGFFRFRASAKAGWSRLF